MNGIKTFGLIAVLFFFGCASTADLKILTDYDDTANFNDYKAFVICVDDLFEILFQFETVNKISNICILNYDKSFKNLFILFYFI